MTCKDCIHYDVCSDLMAQLHWKPELCITFKDKSRIIELSCKIGDTVYYVYNGWMSDSYVAEATVCGISAEIYERKDKYICMKIVYKDLDGYTDRANAIYGSRVFLTKREAEIKLKELRK